MYLPPHVMCRLQRAEDRLIFRFVKLFCNKNEKILANFDIQAYVRAYYDLCTAIHVHAYIAVGGYVPTARRWTSMTGRT